MSHADGGRIIHLAKRRERAREDAELRLQQLEEERRNAGAGIETKFTANYDAIEETLKSRTVGLVTLDEMREKQKDAVVQSDQNEDKLSSQKRVLSFAFEDEEEEDEEPVPPLKKRLGMDPTVDTSFLPDREREEKLAQLKEQLADEWRSLQDKEKNEDINVAYSYWDGSSHRKDMRMKKGHTISQFLTKAIEVLKKEFTELKTATSESLMFVKEDLIIPHFYTFQDFIATKAMGKTGPLWQFDAAGEIRVRQDAALDCGEAHPAKVVLRSWYEKNKHIYPASRWEAFLSNFYSVLRTLETPAEVLGPWSLPIDCEGARVSRDKFVVRLPNLALHGAPGGEAVALIGFTPRNEVLTARSPLRLERMHHRNEATNGAKANLDEEVGFLEFLSTDRESELNSSAKGAPCGKSLKESQKKKSSDSIGKEANPERKMSGESGSSLIPKSALRMKAFRNCHKATFHSLDFPDSEVNTSSSTESTPAYQSISGDLLQMPNFETLQLNDSKKTHSDPTLRRGASRNAKSAPSKVPTQRVLHTIERSDGSVIGFCTEEPLREHE
ncbi:hypothetical protein QR680_005365 [Steinernema hermaphroditum]|uniref:Protein FAM50 homolog n=1 Tax=Steinernema hermaphroditum TaxID=289476 RepID=A0AA39HRQ4_9BILA|nr:hypothetical protein QR680_005365 [Steinernema hermaphroditum]